MTVKQILLAFLMLVFPLVLIANDFYVATIDLNVRTGAGQRYPVYYTLQKGEEVEFISKENNWYQIKYSGKTGYAHSKYLKYNRTTSESNDPISSEEPTKFPVLSFWIFLALIGIVLLFKKKKVRLSLNSFQPLKRGTRSERDLVVELLRYGFPEQRIFHDLYLETKDNRFSQIDVVAISKVGIIVFEVKDYSGWIFGRGNQPQWTQVLSYGKQKFRFYNPILQNNKHVSVLKEQLLPFCSLPFYSVVVFYGDCELKEIDFVPAGTLIVSWQRIPEVIDYILKVNKAAEYNNEDEILRVLNDAVTRGGIVENQIQHAENIKDMLGKHRVFD